MPTCPKNALAAARRPAVPHGGGDGVSILTPDSLPADFGPSAVCLGTFDGVHRGHRALIGACLKTADEKGLMPCAYTFDFPPAAVLSGRKVPLLSSIEEKAQLMALCGMSTVIWSHFDESISGRSAEDFFQDLLLEKLHARHIVIGFHYHFGRKAEGNADRMRQLCALHGIGLTVVPPVTLPSGEVISSTAVRAALLEGNRARAAELLGRPLTPQEEALLSASV